MKVVETGLAGVKLITPDVFKDERGFFKETFSLERYAQAGITSPFVQDNVSVSMQGVLRGMHYDPRMAKLVQVLFGRVFDVVVDMREGSATYKQWDGFELTADNHYQVYVPPGVAHGFLTLSDRAVLMYKQTALYDPKSEKAISWRDPSINIEWPLVNGNQPLLSPKDAAL
ncbi:MAG: dTDP-4-dehydrorhamnose 3,5-epimerase [Candidatus Eremiobacteraeota bacterium]|nr:dTDP-4-dehydrorhamnose 3,5-epimerase [Candidatus Eremiobacteraeota bacterium]